MPDGSNTFPLDETEFPPQPGAPVPADAGPPFEDFPVADAPFELIVSIDQPDTDPYNKVRSGPLEDRYRTLEYVKVNTSILPVYLSITAAAAAMLPEQEGRLFRIRGSTAINVMLPMGTLTSEGII